MRGAVVTEVKRKAEGVVKIQFTSHHSYQINKAAIKSGIRGILKKM